METLKNFIDGDWQSGCENQVLNVHNPANQEVLGKVPFGKGDIKDVESAVAAAAAALPEWRRTSVNKRGNLCSGSKPYWKSINKSLRKLLPQSVVKPGSNL